MREATSGKLATVLALLTVLVCSASAEPSPWDAWRLGYTNYELGEQVRSRGDYTAALEAFEKSRNFYAAVRKARPDWNQKVIRERLAACDKQIAELRRLLGSQAPASGSGTAASTGVPAPSGGGQIEKKSHPEEEQLRALRIRAAELQVELDELRRERKARRNTEVELSKLTWDLQRAREKYSLLEKSYRKLQEDMKKPDTALNELRRQLVMKHDELENAVKTRRLLEERIRRGEQTALDLNRDKNLLRNQLRQGTEEQRRMEREVAALRASGEADRERLNKAVARNAELEKSLRDLENRQQKTAREQTGDDGVTTAELVRLRSIAEASGKRADQFQKQCVELRSENERLLKNLQVSEQARSRLDQENVAMRGEAAKQHTRAESLTGELNGARELQRRNEQELKRLLAELESLKTRLANRDSEDFKALIEARSLQQKLEAGIVELKTRESELATSLKESRAEAERARHEGELLKRALLKVRGEKAALEQETAALKPEAEKFRELLPRYRDMERNFQALRKENQENRLKIAAASPREAELKRVKLRLVELDRLKESLGREQRLTAELTAAKKQLELELADMRGQGVELAAARKQLENLKALRREIQELRQVNKAAVERLEAMRKLEDELVSAKKSLIESGAAQLELHEVKKAYAKVLEERNRAATEAARLRDELAQLSSDSKRNEAAAQEAARLREKLARLSSDSKRNEAAAQEAARLREKLAQLSSDSKRNEAAVQEAARLREKLAQLSSDGKRNEAAAQESARLRERLARLSSDSKRNEAAASGLAQELERTRQELRNSREQVENLKALLPQLEQLKKLNNELLYARSFESELVKARAELGELVRYKDELAGVIKLNERLAQEKTELEKELARRPRLPQSEESAEKIRLIQLAGREKPGDYVADGMLAESRGSEELAIWNYRKALALEPKHAEASERLGKLLLAKHRCKEASGLLAVARAASPDRLDLALAISRSYLGEKRHGNAQAVLEPLLKRYPENGELLTVAALAAEESGDSAQAESRLKLAIRYLPDAAEPKIELARLLIHSDSARLDEASHLYEAARLSGAPPDPELEPLLGPRLDKRRELEAFLSSALNEAFENRDYSGAVWYCRQLLELNRRPGYFSAMLALARYLGGESGAARETLTFNAESAHGMLVLALVELKDGNRNAFSAALRRAVALNGDKVPVIDTTWRNLGFALDAAKAKNPAVAEELNNAYRWESER